ncbi:hypothetical protein ACLB2K_068764 [Fragaria x ananassa]
MLLLYDMSIFDYPYILFKMIILVGESIEACIAQVLVWPLMDHWIIILRLSKYKSFEAFTQILKNEGAKSLFKGADSNVLHAIAGVAVIKPDLRDNPTQPGNLDPIFLETDGRKASELTEDSVSIFEAAKLQVAKLHCPICGIHNDGQCGHFYEDNVGIPSLKSGTRYVALQSSSPPQESHGTATKHPGQDLEDNYVADESHECGNFEHDCPIFQAAKSRLMAARVYRCLGHPSLKCPNAVLQSDDSKRPGPESDSVGKTSKLPQMGTDE